MLAFKAILSMGELNEKVPAHFKALSFTKICPDFRKCLGTNGHAAVQAWRSQNLCERKKS